MSGWFYPAEPPVRPGILVIADADPRRAMALAAAHGIEVDGGILVRWINRPAQVRGLLPGTPVLFGDDRDWPSIGPCAGLMDALSAAIRAGRLRPANPDDIARIAAALCAA